MVAVSVVNILVAEGLRAAVAVVGDYRVGGLEPAIFVCPFPDEASSVADEMWAEEGVGPVFEMFEVEAEVEHPEHETKVGYGGEFFFAEGMGLAVGRDESVEVGLCGFLADVPGVCVKEEVNAEGHEVVDQGTFASEVEVEERDIVLLVEVEIFG